MKCTRSTGGPEAEASPENAGVDPGDNCHGAVQLSARVDQLTAHLKIHRKDYASTRGLMKVLSRRKSLMEYLKIHNRCSLGPYAICAAMLENLHSVAVCSETQSEFLCTDARLSHADAGLNTRRLSPRCGSVDSRRSLHKQCRRS